MKSLILAVAVAVMGTFLIPADGGAQGLTAHDSAQTSQHHGLAGQVTTHDAAQTTHDSAQTTEHNALSQKIDNLSTGADHGGLPPTWDKTLPADDPGGPCPSNSSRFTCVMGNAAVRDNETGLVWEQSPSTTRRTWENVHFSCNPKTVGNRKGWRLPTVQELASLVDPSIPFPGPTLPPGHPFSNVQSEDYWSASDHAFEPRFAWSVRFGHGSVVPIVKDATIFVWCVRGGQGVDIQ